MVLAVVAKCWPLLSVAWTAWALAFEMQDRSWGALGMAFIYGPGGNALIAILGSLYVVVAATRQKEPNRGLSLVLIWAAAFFGSAVLFFAVLLLPLHGC
jgi:hypothetical protein